jgi:hypothetical protein
VAAENTREGYWTWVAWEMSIAAEEEEPAA